MLAGEALPLPTTLVSAKALGTLAALRGNEGQYHKRQWTKKGG